MGPPLRREQGSDCYWSLSSNRWDSSGHSLTGPLLHTHTHTHTRTRTHAHTLDHIIRLNCFCHSTAQSESELLYDWRFTANQFVFATSPLRLTTNTFIFQLNACSYSPYVSSSLKKGWVCRLQLLLVFASAVILRFESRGTHDHILLSHNSTVILN
jgi:hypothetical protein